MNVHHIISYLQKRNNVHIFVMKDRNCHKMDHANGVRYLQEYPLLEEIVYQMNVLQNKLWSGMEVVLKVHISVQKEKFSPVKITALAQRWFQFKEWLTYSSYHHNGQTITLVIIVLLRLKEHGRTKVLEVVV